MRPIIEPDEVRKISEKAIQMADGYDRINNHLADVVLTMSDAWKSEENLLRVKRINKLCGDMRRFAQFLKEFGEDMKMMADSYEEMKNSNIDASLII